MIDLHCHILPGIDDGPSTLDEAVAMCRIAHGDGITTIVATPHFKPGTFEHGGGEIVRGVAALNTELKQQGIKVNILAGADISVTPELAGYLASDPFLSINGTGRYFLAELPHETMPAKWDQFLLALRRKGLVPIITHPERNRWFVSHREALVSFVLAGGLVQITAMSVTGAVGPEVRDFCRFLLRRKLVHVIASDAHSVAQRPPVLSGAVKIASDIIGQVEAERLVRDNPRAIIEGRNFEATEPVISMADKRKWYQRILDL